MPTTETLGYLLQGVSQQQPKVRSLGQVSEQVNFYSDVKEGLTARPATVLEGSCPVITSETSTSHTVEINDVMYRIVLDDATLPSVFAYDGSAVAVTGSGEAYISTDSAVYVYDDTVYIVNRNMIVEASAATYTSTVTQNWGYVYVLGGAFTRRYQLNLTVNGYVVAVEYTTPDGLTAGDAEKCSADYIINQMYTLLVAALAAVPITTVTVQKYENHLRITDSANQLNDLSARDGENGLLMRGGIARAKTVAELPKYAAHGDYIFVFGQTSSDDDFWMRYAIDGVTTVGTAFGQIGAWKEYFNVAEPSTFDASTMPHKLVFDGTDFTFGPEDWYQRRVGNETSNPTPSFVGAAIRDIREFQGRLLFATSKATVVGSRTDEPTDFWRKSAVADFVSDVVDMRATKDGTKPLDWFVPFDKDMYVLSSNAQYVLSGANSLTPANSGITLATNYAMSTAARPAATGRTILIPFYGAQYSGVNEYFTNKDFASTAVDNLNKTSSKYIEGEITQIATATNEGLGIFLTTESGTTGVVYCYKYLWEFEKKTQSAWGKWQFSGKVRHVHYNAGVLYFWIVLGEDTVWWVDDRDTMFGDEPPGWQLNDLGEVVVSMRLDFPTMFDFDYRLCIDGAVENGGTVVGDELVVTTPYDNPAFILNSVSIDAPAGSVIEPDTTTVTGTGASTRFEYRFNLIDRPWMVDGVVSYGQRYTRYIDPTPPFARDSQGVPRSDVQLVVRAYYVDYADTGQFSVEMRSKIRGNSVMADTDWMPLDDDPEHPWEESVRSGTLQAPWGEYAKLADLRIVSDDIKPTTIQEIRYDPEYLKAGG